jgi:hypothetical protein
LNTYKKIENQREEGRRGIEKKDERIGRYEVKIWEINNFQYVKFISSQFPHFSLTLIFIICL